MNQERPMLHHHHHHHHRAGGDYRAWDTPHAPARPSRPRPYVDPESYILIALVIFFMNPLFGFIACALSLTSYDARKSGKREKAHLFGVLSLYVVVIGITMFVVCLTTVFLLTKANVITFSPILCTAVLILRVVLSSPGVVLSSPGVLLSPPGLVLSSPGVVLSKKLAKRSVFHGFITLSKDAIVITPGKTINYEQHINIKTGQVQG
ncbi:hypothetical protein LSAT2_014213 [Lamellibrachia satsuma]|nr:hypothetical protein LSAT2_014213 [Lamellibrachia satsuma]